MASGLENIETIESPFRRFVTTIGVFPTAFTDAMTYYECLAYLVKYLEDTVITAVNENAEALEELQTLYIQLKSYVDNYFANLDIQEEINNKLDAMAEDGTLQEIITAYIQSNVAWTFDTVADMKQATNLVAGSYAQTLGFHTINDGGGATYYISDSGAANEMDVIAVGSLHAILVIPTILAPEQVGCYGNGTTDDTTCFARACEISKIVKGKGTYLVGETTLENVDITADITGSSNAGITLDDNVSYEGNFVSKYATTGVTSKGFNVVGDNVRIKDSVFSCVNNRATIAIDVFKSASNVVISGCRFKPDYKIDIMIAGNEVVIENCVFDPHTDNSLSPIIEYGNGIKLSQSSYDESYDGNGDKIVIKNNTILNHGDNPIDCFTGATNVRIEGNYILSPDHTGIEIKVTNGDYGTEGNYNYIISNNILSGDQNINLTKGGDADFYNFIISDNIFTSTKSNTACLIVNGAINCNISGCEFNGNGSNHAINFTETTNSGVKHVLTNCTFNGFNFVIHPTGDYYAKIFMDNCKVTNSAYGGYGYEHTEYFISNSTLDFTNYVLSQIAGKVFVTNSRITANYAFVASASTALISVIGCKINATTGVFNRSSSSVKFNYALVACDLSGSPALPYYATETLALATAS